MATTANKFYDRRKTTCEDVYALLGFAGDSTKPMENDAEPDPMVGQLFADQYEIHSVLGKGGMSIVYKARHRLMDRIVAIKVLHGEADELAIARFKLEAKAASSLSHSNIVTVHDFGILNKEAYLIMDYLEGTDLADILEKESRLPLERVVNIFIQTCEGLRHAHLKGIVHRDLKPSNLCLLQGDYGNEQVKIVDFGIAKFLPQRGEQPTQLTQTGDIFGSPLYMSPEQCLAQPLDARSDIYSLGCVMYECLTGVPPHAGDSAFNTMTKHVGVTPPGFDKVSDVAINKSMEAIVFRCLEKKREDRYQSVAEVIADLQSVLPPTNSSAGKRVVAHPAKQRREVRFLRYGFWTLLCFLSALFAYMALDNGTSLNRGTVLEKTVWNAEVTFAKTLIDCQLYQPAQAILKSVEHTADEKFGNRGPQMIALYMERDLYKKARMYEDLETTNRKITDSTRKSLLSYYDSTMKEVDDLLNCHTDVERSVNKVMAGITLITVGRTARALTYNSLEQHAEHLLTHARSVYEDLLGNDDVSVAGIDVALADYYSFQQETPLVRPLIVEAVSIFERKLGLKDKRTILALMKLGQLDRDENDFAAAKLELQKALNSATEYFPSDLTLVSRCLRSYADYCDQTFSHDEATSLYHKAAALSAKASGQDAE